MHILAVINQSLAHLFLLGLAEFIIVSIGYLYLFRKTWLVDAEDDAQKLEAAAATERTKIVAAIRAEWDALVAKVTPKATSASAVVTPASPIVPPAAAPAPATPPAASS